MKQMNIRQIYAHEYPQGKQVVYTYSSDRYYDVQVIKEASEWTISLTEAIHVTPFEKHQKEEIFESYKEGSEVYVAEVDGQEAAVVVIQYMEWNKTLLIHDLYVDRAFKKQGIGSQLMERVKKRAKELGARAVTLETQSSNYPAIQFYVKNGFEIIGISTISYTNSDVQNKEVRIEMGFIV